MNAEPEFRTVPLELLRESATNPRRHFEDAALEDLVASVKTHGVLVPLLVRPVGTNGDAAFEIVAGARRFRAAKKAELAEIPVRSREMTDEQVLEVSIVDNLQRENVHPLDEALGYQALIDRAKYDVDSIAAKVGKSSSYVYQRLKLSELCEHAQRLFLEDRITAGHAILIARLTEAQQKRLLKDKLFRDDFSAEMKAGRYPQIAKTVRELGVTIQAEFHLDLQDTPWPKDDATLIEKAGSCVACPKRTGFAPALFPDIAKKDVCTDPDCFQAKALAWGKRRTEQLTAEGQTVVQLSTEQRRVADGVLATPTWRELAPKQKNCNDTAIGIVVEGSAGLGRELRVCTKRERCKTHNPFAAERETGPVAPPQERRAESGGEPDRKVNAERRARIFREIFARRAKAQKPGTVSARDLEVLAAYVVKHYSMAPDLVCELLGWKEHEIEKRVAGATTRDLALYVVAAALAEHVRPQIVSKAKDPLLEAAKRYGVNLKRIDQEIAADQATAGEAAAKPGGRADRKKASKKKGTARRAVHASATAEASA